MSERKRPDLTEWLLLALMAVLTGIYVVLQIILIGHDLKLLHLDSPWGGGL